MKNLVIIGAGSFGREVYNLALECSECGSVYIVKGFIDNVYDTVEYDGYPPILSRIEDYIPMEDDVFVCAIGDVNWKKKYIQSILNKGGEFISLIHPLAHVSRNVVMGKGCIVCGQSFISCDVHIGNFTAIQPHVMIGHDNIIGEYCQINSNATFGGFVNIGNGVTIHTSAVLLPRAKVFDNATVGAGSVVLRSVPENVTVFGNPARPVHLPETK